VHYLRARGALVLDSFPVALEGDKAGAWSFSSGKRDLERLTRQQRQGKTGVGLWGGERVVEELL